MNVRSVSVFALITAFIFFTKLPSQSVAGSAEAWQPYRMPAAEPQQVIPAQYYTTGSHDGAAYDAISDSDLNQLRTEYCGDPFEASTTHVPLYIEPQYGNPAFAPMAGSQGWSWHVLPGDVIWKSYWAGSKEARISGVAFEETSNDISLLDVTLGGRTSIVRFGTEGQARSPEGWELQIEGATVLRLNLDENWDMEAADFRFGVPLVYGRDNFQWKFSYYHLSSHLGDELIIRRMSYADRINFSRDTLVLGFSHSPLPAWRWYAEAGWAFYADEGTEPWEFQFGVEYAQPGPTGGSGTPFFAINGHLRQEVDFGGNLVAQAGWLWRGYTGHEFRTGLHYFNGKSNQFEFYNEFEQQLGVGLWYDY